VQGRSLLPRLAALPEFGGINNIAMFAWYGLQGGIHDVGGLRCYPAGVDPYGNDIIEAHTKDFAANIVISLIDVWVLKDTAKKVAPALWCVTGETKVALANGTEVAIKDLYDSKPYGRRALGYVPDLKSTIQLSPIQDFHFMGHKPIVEIETESGRKLRTTAESGIYVWRNGHSDYVPASCVSLEDMVYCVAGSHDFSGEENDKLGSQSHGEFSISDGYQADGVGVFGGNNRRGRDDQYTRAHQKAPNKGAQWGVLSDIAANSSDIQYESEANRVAQPANRIQVQRSGQEGMEDQLSGGSNRLSELFFIDATSALSNWQENPGRSTDRVRNDSGGTFGQRAQSVIWESGSGDLANTPRVKLEKIAAVRCTGVLEPVYDLTTSTHNFFANGILIHNCPWTPIDHDPIPEAVSNALQDAHLTLSYSKWGKMMMDKAGIKNEYIPHGVETGIYRVADDQQRVQKFKQELLQCPPGGHLTLMVSANKGYPDRKAFQVQIRAWANFAKDKPHAKLYIHTEPTTMYGGLDLPKLLGNLGISHKVLFPERYQYYKGMPAEYLALVYNAADAFLGASMAEGFGIPLIEAQACGVPVITTDFSAMPELVRWGYKIAPLDMLWTPMNSWQAWPDVRGIQDALEELHAQWEANGRLWPVSQRLKAQEAIHSEYSWDSIVRDNWQPLVARLANEAPPLARPQASPLPRQEVAPPADVVKVGTRARARRNAQIIPGELVTVNGQ